MRTNFSIAIFFALTSIPALALEPACEAILKAGETRMQQPAWHSITELVGGMKLEFIKSGGKFYHNNGDGWAVFPVDVEAAERDLIAQIRSGEIKLTQCKKIGSDVIAGVDVTIVSSHTEMQGLPPATGQLFVGEDDGLPYRQTAKGMSVIYKYEGVTAPKL